MSRFAYSEISSLCSQLGSENQIRKRRDAGEKLLSLLSDKKVRDRLTMEATPTPSSSSSREHQSLSISPVGARRKALGIMWRMVINNSILAANRSATGRSKLIQQDLTLPRRLLNACRKADDNDKNLSKKEILGLLNYCLNMLHEDNALEVAEADLLNLLSDLCNKEHYVACYRPHAEINNILAELVSRLSTPEVEWLKKFEFLTTAKAFAGLLQTGRRLGVGMYLLVPGCIEVASNWCQYHLDKDSGEKSTSFSYIYSGATALLTTHPEQCIEVMKQHGRPMLSLARRCYAKAENKEALHEFFLAHLLVCQVAGNLSGLLPGDLGDVGPASLDATQINFLSSLVASNVELKKAFDSEQRSKISSQYRWMMVDTRQQRHLELCSRVMACSQRLHLARAEWEDMEDPISTLLDEQDEAEEDGSAFPQMQVEGSLDSTTSCPLPELIQSPWVRRIVKQLWLFTRKNTSATGKMGKSTNYSQAQQQSQDYVSLAEEHQSLTDKFEILKEIQESFTETKIDDVISCLQIICACAEVFPCGECWSSSAQCNWKSHTPEDPLESDILYSNGCSPNDLALVVFLVSNVLELCGEANGNTDFQMWSIICLLRLTDSTKMVSHRLPRDGDSLSLLGLVWRRVWRIIFCSNFRYWSYTNSTTSNSMGEIVLMLLTEMVKSGCTDPAMQWATIYSQQQYDNTFMHNNQSDIWKLPPFIDAKSVPICLLDLTYALLCSVDLSEYSHDTIDSKGPQNTAQVVAELQHSDDYLIQGTGRRYKLLYLMLRRIENAISSMYLDSNQQLLRVACACISILVYGEGVPYNTIFALEGSVRLSVTGISNFGRELQGKPTGVGSYRPSLFECFWSTSSLDDSPHYDLSVSRPNRFELIFAGFQKDRASLIDLEQLQLPRHTHSIPSSHSGSLKAIAVGCLSCFIKNDATTHTDSDNDLSIQSTSNYDRKGSTAKEIAASLSRRTSALKAFLTVSISSPRSVVTEAVIEEASKMVVSVFEDVRSYLPLLSTKQDYYLLVATDLFQVLRALTAFFSSRGSDAVPSNIVNNSQKMYGLCRSQLLEYQKAKYNNPHLLEYKKSKHNNSRADQQSHTTVDTLSGESENDFASLKPNNSLDDDSDDDSFNRKKRKRPFQLENVTKKKRNGCVERSRSNIRHTKEQSEQSTPPNFACAKRLASIMILLEPSFDSCQCAVGTLVGQYLGEDGDRGGISLNDLNPQQAIECIDLLCNDSTMFHHRNFNKLSESCYGNQDDERDSRKDGSVVSLCCSIIRSMRDTCNPSLPQHMFGFLTCAKLADIGDSDLKGAEMHRDDCDEIIQILKSDESKKERRSLLQRPYIRSTQLRAATKAFSSGRTVFHSKFDHLYATEFVMPSLNDLDDAVRLNSIYAVGVALSALDNARVIESVLKILLPLKDKDKRMAAFRSWYEDKDLGSQGNTEVENTIWEATLNSLEVSSLKCRGIIAGSTKDDKSFREMLFGIIKVASIRPDLQAICFLACEKAASMRGFPSLENMIRGETAWLLDTWMQKNYKLADIPLLMSFPGVFRRLLRAGQGATSSLGRTYASKNESNTNEMNHCHLETEQLTVDAVVDFVGRRSQILIPLIITHLANKNLTKSERGWEYLEEAFSFLQVEHTDTGVAKVLRGHLHDAVAFIFPILQDSKKESLGTRALGLLKSKLTETVFEKQKQRSAHKAIIRMLEFRSMYGHSMYGDITLSEQSYVNSLKAFVSTLNDTTKHPVYDYDIFKCIGSSFTECLIYTKNWLFCSSTGVEKEKRWSAVEVICNLMIEQLESRRDESTQLKFCIHVLIDIVLDNHLQCLRPHALKKLCLIFGKVLENTAMGNVKSEILPVLHRLVGSLLIVHESAQQDFILECRNEFFQNSWKMKHSIGLLLFKGNSNHREATNDLWGWNKVEGISLERKEDQTKLAVERYASNVSIEIGDVLICSFEALNMVLKYCSIIRVKSSDFGMPLASLAAVSPNVEFLSATNDKFYAQRLMKQMIDELGNFREESTRIDSENDNLRDIAETLKTRQSSLHTLHHRSNSNCHHIKGINVSNSLSIDARLMLGELDQLQNILRDSREDTRSQVHRDDIFLLVRELLNLCDSENPGQVRFAASRCLGEIGPSRITSISALQSEASHSDGDGVDDNTVLIKVRTRALELLSHYLKSPRAQTCLVAMETAKALLGTNEGRECWRMMQDGECKRSLQPFSDQKKCTQKAITSILEKYLNTLISSSGTDPDEAGGERDWCWNHKLWIFQGGERFSFEKWIRNLVCAIIICCYDDGFFRICVEMSALEHGFAAEIFPGIVFDLLNTGQQIELDKRKCTGRERIRAETFIGHPHSPANRQLSSCFSKLLRSFSGISDSPDIASAQTADPRPIALVVDTLEMLRIVTQKRFLSSVNHRPNLREIKGRLYPDQGGQRTKKILSDPNLYNKNSDPNLYNKNIGESPTWNGVPFGVVLNLDGLQIAKACIHAKRFATALFYAEMYSDNRFGHSVSTLEKLAEVDFSGVSHSILDISGFGMKKEINSDVDMSSADSDLTCALALSGVLNRCFLELHEYDALKAVEIQTSALLFSHDDLNASAGFSAKLGTTEDLLMLDTKWNIKKTRGSVSLLIAKCMEHLGLRNVLKTYIDSLVGPDKSILTDGLPAIDQSKLKEKWFQVSLQNMQWDPTLLDIKATTAVLDDQYINAPIESSPTYFAAKSSNQSEMVLYSHDGKDTRGFFQFTTEALGTLLHDDTEACSSRLLNARRCLLDELVTVAGADTVIDGMAEFAERFQVLNDLEDLASDSCSVCDVISRWSTSTGDQTQQLKEKSLVSFDEDNFHTCLYGVPEFSLSVREIVLRILCSRTSHLQGVDPLLALISHLKHFCSIARYHGSLDIADASLQRLRQVLHARKDELSESASWSEAPLQLRFEEAKIMERRGDFASAIRNSKLVVNHLSRMQAKSGCLKVSNEKLLSEALLKCGHWMTNYKVEPAKAILHAYLKPASEMARAIHETGKSSSTASLSSSAYLTLAELVANLYESALARSKSQEWRQAGVALEAREKELAECESLLEEKKKKMKQLQKAGKGSSNRSETEAVQIAEKEHTDIYIYTHTLRNEVEMTTDERKKVESSIPDLLHLALESYGAGLSLCGVDMAQDVSRHVFRMISLWFSNCTSSFKGKSVNKDVAQSISNIPSFRFVPLTYQLFSRIDTNGDASPSENAEFQDCLKSLVHKMCIEHPYHCLVQLIALSNGNKVGSGVSNRDADAFLENVGDSKVVAARLIICDLTRSKSAFISDLIESYTALIDSYINLAMAPTKDYEKSGQFSGISFQEFRKKKYCSTKLDDVLGSSSRPRFKCPPCVLTTPPTLRPGCDYGDGKADPIGSERILGFDSTFSITDTGLHRPKIVFCIGSKKTRYKQLVKGHDDIRQDAVMEQVFTYVNDLMKRRSSTSRGSKDSKLKVVTYSIVPLSPAAGVLEWVNDTLPFGDFLLDKKKRRGAHTRYFPGEWGNSLCTFHYKNAPLAAKKEALVAIHNHFSPAFRFFFVERFSHSLQAWHAAKMMYTRSCAVSSIVGHMLGIGDRHSQNILIHEKTGEVVHIDFGIVFEQGKTLSVPETVPFRLTRDIVDGMGPNGTDGTFSRAAQATTAVLRENANSLLTILSAVVSDPLYKWSVSPVKKQQRQQQRQATMEHEEEGIIISKHQHGIDATAMGKVENTNEAATRAIVRIHEKLQGYEDGTSGERQSVEGQVQLLINSARDPDNLSSIYFGWSPWL